MMSVEATRLPYRMNIGYKTQRRISNVSIVFFASPNGEMDRAEGRAHLGYSIGRLFEHNNSS